MKTVLSAQSLRIDLGGKPILRGIDLIVKSGELVGLIGPNGAGKSTLLRTLAGLLPVPCNVVRIDGIDLYHDPAGAKARLGYAVEPARLPEALSGRQCLGLFAASRGLRDVPADSLALVDLLGFSSWLDRPVGIYSLGTRQKLAIALALLGRPSLLLLDEALNGLDPVSALAFKQHLRELTRARDCAVILATHGLEVAARFLDRVILLDEGRISADWSGAALAPYRQDPGGLEEAVVAHLRDSREKAVEMTAAHATLAS